MSAPAGGLFPPEDPARAAVLAVLHRGPLHFGHRRPRWTLALLQQTCLPLHALSLSGIWRRLTRWQLARKRSRDRLTSPDPAYQEKLTVIQAALTQARATPSTHTVLYGDEFTYYRHPAPGYAYWERGRGGHHQPVGQLSYRSNTKRRVIGALDVLTGQVHHGAASKMGITGLRQHLRQLRAAYGPERTLTLVWDNWPIHFDPRVVAEATAQRITLLRLPTYAPWTNPIEKLWDWLKADVLRLHPWSDQWEELQVRVTAFLTDFAAGSEALLRYVGLAPVIPTEPLAQSP